MVMPVVGGNRQYMPSLGIAAYPVRTLLLTTTVMVGCVSSHKEPEPSG